MDLIEKAYIGEVVRGINDDVAEIVDISTLYYTVRVIKCAHVNKGTVLKLEKCHYFNETWKIVPKIKAKLLYDV
jgi:hypothetical protein